MKKQEHDFESEIVGRHDPVPDGRGWLPIGYAKPIIRYTCKKCGKRVNDGGVTGFGIYGIMNAGQCLGKRDQ